MSNWKPNYYHTSNRIPCDTSNNMLHMFGHFSPYFQRQCVYDTDFSYNSVGLKKPIIKNIDYEIANKNKYDAQNMEKVNKQTSKNSSHYNSHNLTSTCEKSEPSPLGLKHNSYNRVLLKKKGKIINC